MARISPKTTWKLAKAIKGRRKAEATKSGSAKVSKVDGSGTVWVRPTGSSTDVPVNGASVAYAKVGDTVTYETGDGRLKLTGNSTDPAVGAEGAKAVASAVVDIATKPIMRKATEASDASAAAQRAAAAAKAITDAIGQFFWHDTNGAHVSTEEGNPDATQNTIWNSLGMLFRKGTYNVLAVVTGQDPGIDVYDGTGNAGSNIIAAFHGSGARIGPEDGTHVSIDSDSMDVMGDDEAVLATFGADETHLGLAGKGAVFLAGDSFELMADSYSSYPPEIDWDDMHALQLGSCRIIPLDEEDDDPMSTVDETYFEVLDRGNVVKIVSRRREWYGKEPTEPPWTRGDLPFDRWIAPDTSHMAKVELGTDSNGSSLSLSADVLWANDALVGNPREDGRYGTASQSSNVSVATGTGKAICSHEFGPGVYVIVGHVQFASNATGYRACAFSTTSGSVPESGYASTQASTMALSGRQTHLSVSLIWSVSSTSTLYLNALHNRGSALNAVGQMRWVKLL